MYKLIVSDIDATLINSKFLIPDYNLEMIRRVREAGIQFMLCTGRLFGSARPYAKFLDLDTPLITSNGAVTMEWRERRDLFGTPMDPDTCAEVFRILDEMEMYYHFYSKDTFYSRKPPQEITGFRIMNEKLPEDERFPMLQTDDPQPTRYGIRYIRSVCVFPIRRTVSDFWRGSRAGQTSRLPVPSAIIMKFPRRGWIKERLWPDMR